MPPPSLRNPEDRWLASAIIETLMEGHRQRRPDLAYPESHSDMTWAVYALLEMFEVKRRPVARRLLFEGKE